MKHKFNVNNKQYSTTITRDGKWFVAIEKTTGCATQGKTIEEALNNIKEAVDDYKPGDVVVCVKYGNELLAKTVVKAILKQANINEDEFLKAYK